MLKTGEGIRNLKELLARSIPEGYGNSGMITGDLVDNGDWFCFVMPQDIRQLGQETDITQVQTLRELLDKNVW